MTPQYAARMHALFKGNEEAYGTFKLGQKDEKGKLAGTASTVKGKPVTDDLWLKHLKGETGLGIVPIDYDNMCRWGCIDVDDYPPQTANIQAAIARHKFPVYLFLSKSGGLHIMVFLKHPVPAKQVREWLQAVASALGLGDKEIFPKQAVKGAVGNWLNMPYFGNTRQCLLGNVLLSLEAFLDTIKPLEKLSKILASSNNKFPDGPPCLQTIAEYGPVGAHEKHDALFAIGTYLKLAAKEEWASKLRECNFDTTLLPSGHTGIEPLITDLEKNKFPYPCDKQPIKRYCNRALCMTRKWGVAQGRCMPTHITAVGDGRTATSYITVWAEGVEHEIEVATEDLFDKKRFDRVCYDHILDKPPVMKQSDWEALLLTIPKDKLFTAELFQDTLFNALKQYCMKNRTTERGELVANEKKCYFEQRRQRVYFRATPAAKFLTITLPSLERLIRNNGGNNGEQLILPGNINRRFSWLPLNTVAEELPDIPLPPVDEDPL